MSAYTADTAPVLEYYRARKTRIEGIDGVGPIDVVTGRLVAALNGDKATSKAAP